MVQRRRGRLHRLRRARQRDDRSADRLSQAGGPADGQAADGAYRTHRQHLRYACRCAGISIYMGITIAEFYRDMGYDGCRDGRFHSRWAEGTARDIGSAWKNCRPRRAFFRPTYPRAWPSSMSGRGRGRRRRAAGLSDHRRRRLATGRRLFRAGDPEYAALCALLLGLDKALASARHFPAVNWMASYSQYVDAVEAWWRDNVAADWRHLRDAAMAILQEEDRLQQIVRLVGPEALPMSGVSPWRRHASSARVLAAERPAPGGYVYHACAPGGHAAGHPALSRAGRTIIARGTGDAPARAAGQRPVVAHQDGRAQRGGQPIDDMVMAIDRQMDELEREYM